MVRIREKRKGCDDYTFGAKGVGEEDSDVLSLVKNVGKKRLRKETCLRRNAHIVPKSKMIKYHVFILE